MSQPNFSAMPPELIERFLLKLPIKSIQNLCQVDTRVQEICSSDLFWKKLVNRDFHISQLIKTDSWKCLYQLLSTRFYSYMTYSDFNDETGYYLTLEGAFKQMLKDIDVNEHLFRLMIDYSSLNERTGISQEDIDRMMTEDFKTILNEIENPVARDQFILIRQAVHIILRETFESDFLRSGSFEIDTMDQETHYKISVQVFNLEDEISHGTEYDFIELSYRGNGEFEGKMVRKIDLHVILDALKFGKSQGVRRPVLKRGTITYWITNGSKLVLKILDPKFEPIITQFFMKNGWDLF